MINKIVSTKTSAFLRPLLHKTKASVHDWSHIYDGIYKFEDNTLG